MRMLLDLDTYDGAGVSLIEDEYGLLVGVANPSGTRFTTLTDEQAEELERALYLHRITKPFAERQKEDNA